VTEAFPTRHDQGVRGGRDAALPDIAQDHALYHLHRQGLFDRGLVIDVEAVAEKLARFRRVDLARDLNDLSRSTRGSRGDRRTSAPSRADMPGRGVSIALHPGCP